MKIINLSTILLSIIFLSPILVSCNNGKHETAAQDNEVFTIVEKYPEYPGGIEAFYAYLQNNLRYPLEARNNGTEGQVDLQFTIDRAGQITSIAVLNGIGHGCDQEVLKVLSGAQAFTPGEQRGRSVSVRMSLAIIFKLNEQARNPDGSKQGVIVVEEAEIIPATFKVEASYQDGQWSGKILSTEGEALPGTNIVISGTNIGTVSDLDGTFTIRANKEQTLTVSYVGYETTVLSN